MNLELPLKLKEIFEEQKSKLIYSQAFIDESFHIQKEDLLDETDTTSTELENSMRMRLRNREALYLKKINEALIRIEEGIFGECEECGDDIDPRRLEARPTTTLCIQCKEEQEHKELLHIDGHKHKSLGSKLKLA